MPTKYSVLQNDDSSSSSSDEDQASKMPPPASSTPSRVIPSYEDLSSARADEETVLQAVYDNDFKCVPGTWGCPKLQIHVKPPDTEQCFCQVTLNVQLSKQYPYVPPNLELSFVQGLSSTQQNVLLQRLQAKARELAQSGTVMVLELVQLVEDFLAEHNEDPTISAWEQMKNREREKAAHQQAIERQLSQLNHGGRTSDSTMTNATASNPTSKIPATTVEQLAPDIARELARQRQAMLVAASQQQERKQGIPPVAGSLLGDGGPGPTTNFLLGEFRKDPHDDEDEDDDDDNFDEFEAQSPLMDGNNSRYRTDFIELGILGRGGGGEVVKVRNRLDRRICKFFWSSVSFITFASNLSFLGFLTFNGTRYYRRCNQEDYFGI